MIKQVSMCDICGETGIDTRDLAVHQQPVKTYGFVGGEIISYGGNCGSGFNVAIILEPTLVDKKHVQRYSTLGLYVLTNRLWQDWQAKNHESISRRGFPPLNLDDLANNRLDPLVPNPVEYRQRKPLVELTPEQFEILNRLLTSREHGKEILSGYAHKAFGENPKGSALDVINYFYPHIKGFSLGHLKSGEELIYDGH